MFLKQKKTIEQSLDILVFVLEDQFPDKDKYAIIHVVMNDETGDIETYSDTSCSRPVSQKSKLKNGKYEFEIIQ